MYPLFESIRCINGELCNIEYHNTRMNNSRKSLFGALDNLMIQNIVPLSEIPQDGIYKCRLSYGVSGTKYEIVKYIMKNINSVKVVMDDSILYDHKYSNRETLNHHLQSSGADEIIIIKNGFVTDTSFTNILFFDGAQWFTSDTPLLNGTQRQRLIDEHKVIKRKITPADIFMYKKIRLINAMIPFESEYDLSIENVHL